MLYPSQGGTDDTEDWRGRIFTLRGNSKYLLGMAIEAYVEETHSLPGNLFFVSSTYFFIYKERLGDRDQMKEEKYCTR